MASNPPRLEIDHRTIKLFIGLIAVFLGSVTGLLSNATITSISESYYNSDWGRNILVGSLTAIAAFLLAYNGRSRLEMVLSKIASVSAIGVAMFPCECGIHPHPLPIHGLSAATMFIVLAMFCYMFYARAVKKPGPEAKRRAFLYFTSGLAIVGSILALGVDHFANGAITAVIPRLLFYCETIGLVAFGITWLAASHVLPVVTSKEEKYALFNKTGNANGEPGVPLQPT